MITADDDRRQAQNFYTLSALQIDYTFDLITGEENLYMPSWLYFMAKFKTPCVQLEPHLFKFVLACLRGLPNRLVGR